MPRILVVDDQDMLRDSIAGTLARDGHEVVVAADGHAALGQVAAGRFDLVLTDLTMPGMTGLELLSELKKRHPELPVVLMTAFASVATAVEAMKQGAYDYIQKPFDGAELRLLVKRSLEHAGLVRENATLRAISESIRPRPLIGGGPAMSLVRAKIAKVAASAVTVLIFGESGTGKEVVARAIHAASDRRDRPMLAINCAALSDHLLEAELFGHERGAFPGADRHRIGQFELADGGTLLLDEIGEIPPAIQGKLLRVLQEGTVERVGSAVGRRVDVRVIATTNRDLEDEVRQGRFRQDLYYRLNVIPIELPPLRERTEDVAELSNFFLSTIARRDNKPTRAIEPGAVRLLKQYRWPGNVRELQNILERACVLEPDPTLVTAELIEPWLKIGRPAETVEALAGKPLADIERQVILSTLQQFKGHRLKTAGALGIGVRTLGIKLKRWKDEGQSLGLSA